MVKIDRYGCVIPSQAVVLNRTELTASTIFGEFVNGKLDYKDRPELVELVSKASKDALAVDYLVCIANKRGDVTTQEQKDHLLKRLDFMRGVPPPTPAQIAQWQERNPFPPPIETAMRMLIASHEERLKEYQEREKEREKEYQDMKKAYQEREKAYQEQLKNMMEHQERLTLRLLSTK
ncbi:MAG: hypothetical protein MRJ68_20935 [Nitrospira sp.]|nr:hypothetical protein [Nitrospira sp.]